MMLMTFVLVRGSYERKIFQMMIERYQTVIANEAQHNSIMS